MASCPTCAAALDQNDSIFFCHACQASLQPLEALSSTLFLPVGVPVGVIPGSAEVIGKCPACAQGRLRTTRLQGETLAACDSCRAIWVTRGQLSRIRAHLARSQAPAPDLVAYAERFEKESRIAFDGLATNRYAYPAALGAGVLAHMLGLSFLVWGTVEMWFHELGHAIVAWLSGFVAVPLPFFTIMPREVRSGWVVAIVLGTIGAIAYESATRRLWGLVAFAGGLAVTQLVLTALLNPAQARQWGIFAGHAGAIVLPTLVMVAFYQPLGWRWDFWRYPAVVVAAVGFVHALLLWTGVARGTGVMPHGSAIGDDSEGDMERLIREFSWTKTSLASSYVALALACLLVLVATYVVFLRRAVAKHSPR